MNSKSIFNPTKYNSIIHIFSVLLLFSILYTLFFSPVLFSGRLLAPGDGIVQSVPAFYAPRTLWTPLLQGGFPVAADPQVQTWYPISFIFSFIANSWNAFVISAYVLASCFTYGYVYTITRSKLAAVVSGIIYGMSGFMMAHLGHTMMIHGALWMPLLIWALEKLRHKFSRTWLVIVIVAVACSILAGHPQIAVYSLGLSTIYALVLGWTASMGRWKYYKLCLSLVFLGVTLTAIQVIPTIELMNLGPRSHLSFADFNFYSLPVHEGIRLFFPWILDGVTEVTGYVGLLTILLAIVGFIGYFRNIIVRFWLCTTLLAFLLTLGDATPLAWLIYHVPAYNKFRIPARHFVEMTLAMSVLAGFGVKAVQKQLVSNRLLLKTVLISVGVILASLVSVSLFCAPIQAMVAVGKLNLFPWSNSAVGTPLVIFLFAASIMLYWSRLDRSKWRQLLLIVILVIDLGSFGWFCEWKWPDRAPSQEIIKPTTSSQRYRDILIEKQQRMLPYQGGIGTPDEIPVNMSRLWGVPSASGYGPLILSRISKLFPMGASGDVSGTWGSVADRAIDIMSVRYVFLPGKPLNVTQVNGVDWSTENLMVSLGSGCNTEHPNSVKLQVPSPQSATAIGIVSSLACSNSIANSTEVLRIKAVESGGKVTTQSLRAGRDTSEWAYDCSDVLPSMQHKRSPIFESFPVDRDSSLKCEGHKYVTILPLNKQNNVSSIELEWVGTSGAIGVEKISLINDQTKESYPIIESSVYLADLSNNARWRYFEDINKTSVYENLRAMPRVWLVSEVVNAKPDDVLRTIKSSQLPNGRSYEPSKIALVEEKFNFKAQELDSKATAKILKSHDTHIEVEINSRSPRFLVFSDVYYPGWKATIDGKPAHIFKTNYVMRGVLVAAGTHVIKFEFQPTSFYIGAGISGATLFFMTYIVIVRRREYV